MVNSTDEQIETLINYMNANKDVARGRCRERDGQQRTKLVWQEITKILNALGPPVRTLEQWKKVWADKKYKLRNKTSQINTGLRGTGGGPPVHKQHTNEDLQILSIMGLGYGLPDTDANVPAFRNNSVESAPFGSRVSPSRYPFENNSVELTPVEGSYPFEDNSFDLEPVEGSVSPSHYYFEDENFQPCEIVEEEVNHNEWDHLYCINTPSASHTPEEHQISPLRPTLSSRLNTSGQRGIERVSTLRATITSAGATSAPALRVTNTSMGVTGTSAWRVTSTSTGVTGASAVRVTSTSAGVTGATALRVNSTSTGITGASALRVIGTSTGVTGTSALRVTSMSTAVTGASALRVTSTSTAVTGPSALRVTSTSVHLTSTPARDTAVRPTSDLSMQSRGQAAASAGLRTGIHARRSRRSPQQQSVSRRIVDVEAAKLQVLSEIRNTLSEIQNALSPLSELVEILKNK